MCDAVAIMFDSLVFEKDTALPIHSCTDNLSLSRHTITAQAVPLLNLLLRKQYGTELLEHIESTVYAKAKSLLPNSSSAKRSEKELLETFCFMSWPLYYRDEYMKALIRIIQSEIDEKMTEAESDSAVWPQIECWLKASLFPYARLCFGEELFTVTLQEELRVAATARLAMGRSKGLFDMVAEFPDSLAGLKELRDCMKISDTVGVIGQSFRAVLRKRLLHMGASTTQILDFYVSMIKALRVLDPSDFLLNFVAAPVRKYLFTRKDAVRCIVASLTEGKESELHGELKQGGSLAYAADEDDEESGPGAHWEPRKRNRELAEPTGKDAAARGLDTLALLVSIYGSTDTFIVEYRSLLAEKLISNVGYMTETEVANLELLKIRYVQLSPSFSHVQSLCLCFVTVQRNLSFLTLFPSWGGVFAGSARSRCTRAR
jgi:anaphase-promoting complex subunit 2